MRALASLACLLALIDAAPLQAQEWSRFRGPRGQGVAVAPGLPDVFTEAHVAWRVPLRAGHASPVFRDGRVFVAQAGENGGSIDITCFDATSGEHVWSCAVPHEPSKQHRLNSSASSTPAVGPDGVYTLLSSGGSIVAVAVDHEGKLRWRRELGTFRAQHGSGASPIVFGDTVIVSNETEGERSFIAALETKTGKTAWELERETSEKRAPYMTPVVLGDAAAPFMLLANSTQGLTAVDPRSGEVRWEVTLDFKQRCVAVPAVANGMVLVASGAGGAGRECAAVRLPSGDAEAAIAYRPRRALPYVPSTIALGEHFYMVNDGGIATCIAVATGETVWRERLAGTFFSSPVSNGKTIHVANREGVLFSLRPGKEFEIRGQLDLGEGVFATPAIAHDALYVRTLKHLVCLRTPADKD